MLNDHLHDVIMRNLTLLEDPDRYYNWYKGYTELKLPYYGRTGYPSKKVTTYAPFGNISSKHFGGTFNDAHIETYTYYGVNIHVPYAVQYNQNSSLHFEIEKLSLKDLETGKEKFYLYGRGYIDADEKHIHKIYSPPGYNERYINLVRDVSFDEVRKQKLDQMPGFRFSWYYTGVEVEFPPKYSRFDVTKAFVR